MANLQHSYISITEEPFLRQMLGSVTQTGYTKKKKQRLLELNSYKENSKIILNGDIIIAIQYSNLLEIFNKTKRMWCHWR